MLLPLIFAATVLLPLLLFAAALTLQLSLLTPQASNFPSPRSCSFCARSGLDLPFPSVYVRSCSFCARLHSLTPPLSIYLSIYLSIGVCVCLRVCVCVCVCAQFVRALTGSSPLPLSVCERVRARFVCLHTDASLPLPSVCVRALT